MGDININVAKTAGFCFGVRRAVELAETLARDGELITYGELIHNKSVVDNLAQKGIHSCENISSFNENSRILIRAHGVSDEIKRGIAHTGAKVFDATCPYVEKIHNIVREHSDGVTQICIIGDKNHPEVQGIAGCGRNVFVFADLGELVDFMAQHPNFKEYCTIFVAQTTLDMHIWAELFKFVKKNYTSAKIFDTICKATCERQEEARALSSKSDMFIVLGSEKSSNTCKLYDIGKQSCACTYLAESALGLPIEEIKAKASSSCKINIGLTAGASTPSYIIKEAIKTMDELKNTENFEEMLEESLITLNTGDRVRGTVIGFASNHDVMVDLGTKQAAYIPASEACSGNSNPEEVFNVGDEVEVFVTRVNDVEGMISLSKKKVDSIRGYEELAKAAEEKTVLEGKFADVVKGGAIISYNGVRVFVPASHCPVKKDEDLSVLAGQPAKFVIIEFDRRRNKIVGSVKNVLRNEKREAQEKFWADAEVGKKYKGVVKSLTNYGAFVDIGGIDGMVHISELAWTKIKHPSIAVKVGDEIEVVVKELDKEKNRIALGYKELSENPWQVLANNYKVGDVVSVEIARLTAFGAFAEVIPGIDGLIHISQIANKKIERPSSELTVGQKVDAKIVGIDIENQKLSLSIRALLEPEKAEETPAEETAE